MIGDISAIIFFLAVAVAIFAWFMEQRTKQDEQKTKED